MLTSTQIAAKREKKFLATNKLSVLLQIAVEDVRRSERSKLYRVDMGV